MIIAHPSAPDGLVATLPSYSAATFQRGSAVLCRNTAPLVAFAYSLLQRDVPCRILGRDIGAQLASVVKKMHCDDLETLRERLRSWHSRELDLAAKEDRSPERVSDQYACLVFFISSLDSDAFSVRDLLAKIELMFTDDSDHGSKRVTLSTIHKAKGLEYPTVFLLDRNLLPSRYARLPWQQKQEKNLLYVAVTRAKETLYYISSDCWKE